MPLAEIALKSGRTGGPISAAVSVNAGPGFATHICDVEVDKETGYVKILRYTAVQDVGRAIHPSYVEGQIQGGVTQGTGWALNDIAIKPEPQRVLSTEVAETVRRALLGVVEEGTAKRLNGIYRAADGSLPPVGGKTGTGDNRFDRFGAGGSLISQRVVDRTATFVFFLGDRFFGTITAYVSGAIAERYHFTSAIAVQLLKAIEPQLEPLLRSPATDAPPKAVGQAQLSPTGSRKPANIEIEGVEEGSD